VNENQNGTIYKEANSVARLHLKGRMLYPSCARLGLRVQSLAGEKFCLIVGLNDSSSGWGRQR